MTSQLAPPSTDELKAPPRLDPSRIAVFTDLDGTLARLQATPCAVGPEPERRQVLADLARALDGRLAVVSGRSLGDIDRVLERQVRAVGAVHGLVRRTAAGDIEDRGAGSQVPEAAAAFQAFAKADRGLLVEDKGASVALHYRGAPQAKDACQELAARLATGLGLTVQEGDHVVELRAPGPDKGAAIASFMQEAPFLGHTPVFLGDDLTDEAGFAAVAQLGGLGVIVGPRRPTQASFALPDVAGALAWLRELAQRPAA
jgi:trehalose 6-phosphate phosphatase